MPDDLAWRQGRRQAHHLAHPLNNHDRSISQLWYSVCRISLKHLRQSLLDENALKRTWLVLTECVVQMHSTAFQRHRWP